MQSVVGREVTYNPARLSGVDVYRKSNRTLSQGDRVQFRAPFTEQRIANEELGSIGRITEEELTVALDSRREVSFELAKFITLNRSCEPHSFGRAQFDGLAKGGVEPLTFILIIKRKGQRLSPHLALQFRVFSGGDLHLKDKP